MVRALVLFALLLGAVACSHPQPDATPDGALRAWMDDMESGGTDQAKAAYGLLGSATRKNLEERAERASQVQGRHVEPYEMLAQGRFGMRFRPKSMHATVEGDVAHVEVTGDLPSEHATVQCTREKGKWRVELALPDLPILQRGPGAP